MKIKFALLLLICMLFIPSPVLAMNFVPETIFNSVAVVYTNTGLGSGFAIDKNLIITNAHVVEGSNTVSVTLYNDKTCTGKVIKIDTDVDLALIQVDETLTPLKLGSKDDIFIGKEVYAIGAPKDIPYTMTKGIISAKDRKIKNYEYLQIDASINAGNSGGPLVDENGTVIGINTMKIENAEGLGFAIGTSYIEDFMNDIAPTTSATDEDNQADTPIENDTESNYNKVIAQNENLKIVIIILSILLIVAILIILKMIIKKKTKNQFDFEIEIQE